MYRWPAINAQLQCCFGVLFREIINHIEINISFTVKTWAPNLEKRITISLAFFVLFLNLYRERERDKSKMNNNIRHQLKLQFLTTSQESTQKTRRHDPIERKKHNLRTDLFSVSLIFPTTMMYAFVCVHFQQFRNNHRNDGNCDDDDDDEILIVLLSNFNHLNGKPTHNNSNSNARCLWLLQFYSNSWPYNEQWALLLMHSDLCYVQSTNKQNRRRR